jgi:hypothetical protein
LTSIESRAFYGCSSLTSVSMPASLTRIDDNTFHGCTALRTVEVKWIQPPPLQTYYVSPNAFGSLDLSKVKLIVPGGAQAAYLSAGLWSNFGTIEMDTSTPHHFIINGSGVLTQYVGLGGNVVIPNEVKSIADNVFKDNTSITSVVIPGSVTSIGSSAFQNCSSLTSVSMPASLTLISGYAFYGCSSLVSITIPISVTSIGIYAFDGCTALRTVEAKMLKPPYLSFDTFDSVDLSKVKLIIPYGTLEVYRAAGWIRGPGQMYVPGFENVEVSADVSTFFAINESGVLTRYIGTGGDIVIPDEGKSIASNVFKDNTTITSVVIPGSVTSIGSQAFYGCSNLTSVTISNGVTSIGSSAFYGCSRLTSVTIPNGVTVLEASTFSGCSGLTSVTIPTSVTSIGAAVFSDCTGLTSVTIPGGVTYIGGGAFYGCTSLRTVEARMMQPPSLFPDTFGSVDLSKVRLIIPGGTVAVYQAAGWNGFGNIEDSGANATLGAPSAANTLRAYAANGLLHVSGLTPGERFYVYDMQGRQVYAGLATATDHSVTLPGGRGIYIVASGGQSVKVIYQLIQ